MVKIFIIPKVNIFSGSFNLFAIDKFTPKASKQLSVLSITLEYYYKIIINFHMAE